MSHSFGNLKVHDLVEIFSWTQSAASSFSFIDASIFVWLLQAGSLSFSSRAFFRHAFLLVIFCCFWRTGVRLKSKQNVTRLHWQLISAIDFATNRKGAPHSRAPTKPSARSGTFSAVSTPNFVMGLRYENWSNNELANPNSNIPGSFSGLSMPF